MAFDLTQRPQFYEEQYLGAADLSAAVDYGRIQQARHALGAHTWGIAMGLQLKETTQPGGSVTVHLLPGYAWDGYGRPIVVLAPYKIPEEKFDAIKFDGSIDIDDRGRLIEIWLRYDELATQPPRPGFEVCNGADERARIQETFRIEISERPLSAVDRYSGVTIAAKALPDAKKSLQTFDPMAPLVYDESIPHQALPESQDKARWLIPVGIVRWLPVQNQPGRFVLRDDNPPGGGEKDSDYIRRIRRYIGVVAEEIEAADGAIRLRDRSKDPTLNFQAPTKDQLANATNDLVWVEGNLRVIGNAKLCNGKLDFRDQEGKDFNTPLTIQRKEDVGAGARALQVAIGPDTQNNRFAVGPLSGVGTATEQVIERFAVLSGGNVGIGTSAPTLKLDIRGDDFGRDDGPATLHLWGARIGDTGNATLFLRAFAGGVVALDGTDNRVGIGTSTPIGRLTLEGILQPQQGKLTFFSQRADVEYDGGDDGLFIIKHSRVDGKTAFMGSNIGIGTITPGFKLDVADRMRVRQGNSRSAGIWFFQEDPNSDRAFVGMAGDDRVGFWGQTGANWGLVMNTTSGNVGIGTTNPTSLLDVDGQLNVQSAYSVTGWTSGSSDESLKKDIVPLAKALSKLLQLRGVQFYWKEPEKMGNLMGPQIGLVAQEVEKVFPEWVTVAPNGYKALTFRGFEGLTIEALRELQTEIEELKGRLDKSPKQQPAAGRPQEKKSPKEKAS